MPSLYEAPEYQLPRPFTLPLWGRAGWGLLTLGVESLQHRGEALDRSLGDWIDDELHVPNSLARIAAQALSNLISPPLERCHLFGWIKLAAAGGAWQLHQDRDRAFHLGWLAPGRCAGGVDFGPQRRDPFGSVAGPAVPGIPAVDVGHGQRQHPLADRADHQWRSTRSWPWNELAIAGRIEFAGEVDFAVAQQRSNDAEGFGEPRHAPVE